MKLKYFFNYLSYGALAAVFSLLQKIFAALCKKCSALMIGAGDLLEKTRQKIEKIKEEKRAALSGVLPRVFAE